MTDNYQFDKNSKLFQKFLTLKANKNGESSLEKHQYHNKSVVIPSKRKENDQHNTSNNSQNMSFR